MIQWDDEPKTGIQWDQSADGIQWDDEPAADPRNFKDFIKGSVVGNIPAGIVKGGDLALRGLDTAAAAAAGLFGQEAERDRILRESDARSRQTAQFISENFGEGKAAELGQGLGALPAMINPVTGIPAAVGGVTDVQRTLDEQGVDPETAAAVAKRQAIPNIVTGALPFANVSRLAGAVTNVAGGAIGDYLSQQALQEKGYTEQAAGFNPLDPVQRAIDIAGGIAAPAGKVREPVKGAKDIKANLDALDKVKEEQAKTQGEGTLYVGKDGEVTKELPRKIEESPEQLDRARTELQNRLQEEATRNVEGPQLELLDENGRVIERQPSLDLQTKLDEVTPAAKASPTNTPEFQNWDKGGVIRGTNNEPKTVYHGTTGADIESFRGTGKNGLTLLDPKAIYFSDNPRQSPDIYAWSDDPKWNGSIYPVYIRGDKQLHMFPGEKFGFGKTFIENVKKAWKSGEYDLISYPGELHGGGDIHSGLGTKGETIYVVRNPEQIKSIYNKGTWGNTGKINALKDASISDTAMAGMTRSFSADDFRGKTVTLPNGKIFVSPESIFQYIRSVYRIKPNAELAPVLDTVERMFKRFSEDGKSTHGLQIELSDKDTIYAPGAAAGSKAAGYYHAYDNSLVLGKKGQNDRTFFHEILHAMTERFMEAYPNDPDVKALKALLDEIKEKDPSIKKLYGTYDHSEMISEAYSSSIFKQALMKIKVNVEGKVVNAWKALQDKIASILGISSPEEKSAFIRVLELSDNISAKYAENPSKVTQQYNAMAKAGKLPSQNLKNALGELGQKAENVDVKAAKVFDEDSAKAEAISRIAGVDHIPADPKIDEALINKIKGEADGSNKWALTPGALARATLANSTLVKTVYRLMNNAYKRADRFNRDVVQPVEKTFGKILQNDQKSQVIHDILMRELKKGVDYTADELRSAGVSDDLIMAHLEFRNMMDQALEKQNQVLRDKGLPPVKPIDAYLSARWSGPWRASIKDEEGKIVFQVAEHNRRTAQRAINAIKEKYPNLKYEDLAYKQGREKGDNIEAGYLDMLKLLDPNDERVATLKSIYEDIVTGRTEDVANQEKHFLKKTGVRGFAGDRPWAKNDAKDMFIQQFEYAKNAGRWAEYQKASEGVSKLTNNPDLQESQKNNIAYSKEYAKNQLGFGTSKMFEALDNGIAKALGTSPQELQKYMGGLKTVFYLTKLGLSVPFTVTQILQPAITTPAWHAQLNAEGFKHNPVMSGIVGIGKGLTSAAWHYAQMLNDPINTKLAEKMMTPLQKEAAQYMEANGVIDINPLSDIRKNLRPQGVKAIAAPFEFTIKHSEIIARSIAFMSFVDHLEQSGKFETGSAKGRQALFQKAEDMTNLSMTDYRSHERALAFERGGLMGDAAATLHAYQINNLMQGLKFVKEARQGNMMPLFYMVAMQAVAAGMTGLWFVDDLDDLLDNMKKFMPHDQFMKVKDFSVKNFMVNNLPDWAAYGLVSKATGSNINTRMNASNQIPIWPFEAAPTMRTSKDVAGYAAGQVGGLAPFAGTGLDIADAALTGLNPGSTPNEKMQALYPAMPTAAQGPMERLPQFNAGDVSLNPKDLSQGKYRRTESEKTKRDWGFRSIEEQKKQDNDFALGKVERQMTQRLTDAGNSAKEYALAGKSDKVAEEAIKYAQLGGDPETLFSGLDQAALKKFTTEFDRRAIGAGTGTRQAVEKLQRYLKAHGY